MSKRGEIEAKFNGANLDRHNLTNIPKSVQEIIYYMDYKIRKQLKSFTLLSICGGDRNNFVVDSMFQRAFSTMALEQKVNYYAKTIEYGVEIIKEQEEEGKKKKENLEDTKESIKMQIRMFKGYRNWEETSIEITEFKVLSRTRNSFNIDLRNYLFRNSKKKDKNCFVLEAIKNEDPETIRFSFNSEQDEEKYLPIIKGKTDSALRYTLERQMRDIHQRKKINELKLSKQFKQKTLMQNRENIMSEPVVEKTFKEEEAGEEMMPVESNLLHSRIMERSLCEQMVKSKEDQDLDEELSELVSKLNFEADGEANIPKKKSNEEKYEISCRNIFRIFLPNYHLVGLPSLLHYSCAYESEKGQFYIYESVKEELTYKMQFTLDLPLEICCKALYNMHLFKHWHPEICEAQVKLKISSENSCLTYQHVKKFSEWYRDRDFLLLMHLFKEGDSYYLVGRSIENTNYIPLHSMTRGEVEHMIWRISPESVEPGQEKSKIVMEIKMNHCGLLNRSHQKDLTLNYLKGFENLADFFSKTENQDKMVNYMGFNWINTEESNRQPGSNRHLNSLKTCDFESGSDISEEEQEIFYSIENMSDEEDLQFGNEVKQEEKRSDRKKKEKKFEEIELSEHEIEEDEKIKTMQDEEKMRKSEILGEKEIIEVNEDQIVILPNKYLKKKFAMTPLDSEIKRQNIPFDNFLQKDIWVLEKKGGLRLVNKQKIKAQDSVLSYIMKTLRKNLFSGNGILNISLPVDVFNDSSNLQRVAECMAYGPEFLEKAVSMEPIQRFKYVLAFGLSNGIIYFDVQKPFNPILGQTYQGYIRGCPIYAEQVSHHPPISYIYFVGRGYKVTAGLQSKVNIHMNSGDGINQGLFHVNFDDGQEIVFQTPPGELSGLAVGDRKFNFQGRGYYLDKANQLYCQMKFYDDSGFFSSKKKQFVDEISGEIVKVKENFIKKFLAAPNDKKPSPDKSDILESFCELSGRWPFSFMIDGEEYYNVEATNPEKMIDELYPLHSNSNYREDIFFKKQKDLAKSQTHKERLEVIQRGDRKLREKFHKKTKH